MRSSASTRSCSSGPNLMDSVGHAWAHAGLQSDFLAVITEGAFEGAAVFGISLHHAEGTVHHAIAATVADVGLHEDAAELGAHDRAGGTGFEAAGVLAVLADVGGEPPREMIRRVASEAGLEASPSTNFTWRQVECPTAPVLS